MTSTPINSESVQELPEIDQLRQLVAQFVRNADDRSYSAVADLFDEDASLDLGGAKATKRTGILEFFRSTEPLNILGLHSTVNLIVTKTASGANISADFFWINLRPPMPQIEAVGRYYFDFVKTHGRWKIASLKSTFRVDPAVMSGGAAELFTKK